MTCALQAYNDMVTRLTLALPKDEQESATARRKAVRQASRAVLPNATETKIVVTANVRALRHFIEMRASEFADIEIRRLAIEVLRLMQAEAPLMFGDFESSVMPDGTTVAKPAHSKV